MGQEATNFVKGMIKGGQKIRFEIDVQPKDENGKLLGYVFIITPRGSRNKVPKYNTKYPFFQVGELQLYKFFLNATIINSGYATPDCTHRKKKFPLLIFNEGKHSRFSDLYSQLIDVIRSSVSKFSYSSVMGRPIPRIENLSLQNHCGVLAISMPLIIA